MSTLTAAGAAESDDALARALRRASARESLSRAEARAALAAILAGNAEPARVAGLLVALAMKGESVEEIVGFAEAMRAAAHPLAVPAMHSQRESATKQTERARAEIIAARLRGLRPSAERPTAYILAGGPGSGKTVLARGILRARPMALRINLDDLRSALPGYDPTAADRFDHEAGEILRDLAAEGVRLGLCLIFDGTFGGDHEYRKRQIYALKAAGYRVCLDAIQVTEALASRRARARAANSLHPADRGRLVEPARLRQLHRQAAANFLICEAMADRSRIFDGARTPLIPIFERVGSWPAEIYNQAIYGAFQRKAARVEARGPSGLGGGARRRYSGRGSAPRSRVPAPPSQGSAPAGEKAEVLADALPRDGAGLAPGHQPAAAGFSPAPASALFISGTGRDALAPPVSRLLDTCGTGGDASGTFNISTATALVAAAAGARVAKHGNRSISSRCGSADVLEALGINVRLDAARAGECLARTGFAFLYAPEMHPAMARVQPVRRALGMRTIFNLLGPLTNPAGAEAQVVGVYAAELVPKLAEALRRLGVRHALVVHGEDGLDEISTTAPTRVAELRAGEVREFVLAPEDFGLRRATLAELAGGDAAENAAAIRAIFAGERGPKRDIVLLNAAAALLVAGLVPDLPTGLLRAAAAVDGGAAAAKLRAVAAETHRAAAQPS